MRPEISHCNFLIREIRHQLLEVVDTVIDALDCAGCEPTVAAGLLFRSALQHKHGRTAFGRGQGCAKRRVSRTDHHDVVNFPGHALSSAFFFSILKWIHKFDYEPSWGQAGAGETHVLNSSNVVCSWRCEMSELPFRVFWQPGCSSCVKVKEFLTHLGVPFESVNVLTHPNAMEDLQTLGAQSIPIVSRGNQFVFGQSLAQVAEFIGKTAPRTERLPP